MPMTDTLLVAALAGLTHIAARSAAPAPDAARVLMAQATPDLPTWRPEEMQAGPLRAFDIDKDGTLDHAELASPAGQALLKLLR